MKANIKPIYECRCNGRLQTKRSTRLSHTGLVVELEDLKIKTRLQTDFKEHKGAVFRAEQSRALLETAKKSVSRLVVYYQSSDEAALPGMVTGSGHGC